MATATQGGWVEVSGGVQDSEPKTSFGLRTLALDDTTLKVVQRHRSSSWSSEAADGPAFCWPDGRAIRPDWLTHRFRRLVDELDLPPIRLHDLRHGAATMAQVSDVAFDASFDRFWDYCAVTDWVSASWPVFLTLPARHAVA